MMDHDGPWWTMTMVILSLDLQKCRGLHWSFCVATMCQGCDVLKVEVEIEQPEHGIVLACIVVPEVLHNPSPSLSIVHLCFGGLGPYCGGLYCVFSKAWCDTSEWSSIPVCGLGMSSGQVGIKVLDLVAKWALPCEPVCQVWQVKIFLLRPWVPSKVTASILLADPFGLSFCGSQPKNHIFFPSKVCSRESESAWTLFVLPLFRRSTYYFMLWCYVAELARLWNEFPIVHRMHPGSRILQFQLSENQRLVLDCHDCRMEKNKKYPQNILKNADSQRLRCSAWCRVRQET